MQNESKKTVLVTGGAGFVGSHLCERLFGMGYRVISLDNYFAGSKDNHIEGVEYREGHTKDIEKHIPENPDIIFHLGEYSRVEQSVLEPDVVHDLNVLGTDGVLNFWRKKKCKLVYAGSSTKFGDGGKTRETSPYAKTKADNTERVREIGERENLPYAITYFYNVYGPRERSGMYGTVIEIFKQMYLEGMPIAVTAPGTQKRNFTHVADIVDALVLVGEKGQGDEFGLGNETSFTILEVAKMFGEVIMLPERAGNRMTSGLDTSKINALGWRATRDLKEYIKTFTSSNKRGDGRDARILVFTTTFYPVVGPAEKALTSLMKKMPNVDFDIVTTKFRNGADTSARIGNATIHRVGFGNPFDKFLLPILGAKKARALCAEKKYLFSWSLMASYGALAAIFARRKTNLPILVTLADQKITWYTKLFLSTVLQEADQVYASISSQEKHASRGVPRRSLGKGDAFANQIRFTYASILAERVK